MRRPRKYLPVYMIQLQYFYQQVLLSANKAIISSLLLVASLIVFLILMTALPSVRLLAPIQANGQPLTENLRQNLYTEIEVIDWSHLAVSRLFDLSYAEKKRYFNELKYDYLTARGFSEFYTALQQIDMIDWLATEGHASIFVPSRPQVLRHGIAANGRYKWRLLVNGTLILLNKNNDIQLPYQLTIDLLRVSQLGHEVALRIDRVIAEKRAVL